MKLFVAILVAVCISAVIADDETDWLSFKMKFGKLFLSKGKEQKRKNAFKKHKANIDELQAASDAGEITFTPAMYTFHDLEDEEIQARMTGLKVPEHLNQEEDETETEIDPETRQNLPTNYDSRTVIKINTPRDQGSCGSCWTFSAIAALEGSYASKNSILIDGSEQQLVDCVYGPSESGCDGGWPNEAIDYLAKNYGSNAESIYPYTGAFKKCAQKKTSSNVAVTGSVHIPSDDNSLKAAIMKYGIVSVCVDANGWSYYGTGVFKAKRMGQINHAVAVVGWGYDTTAKDNYWLIRNSWGPTWGENGYIRVSTSKLGTMSKDYNYAANL